MVATLKLIQRMVATLKLISRMMATLTLIQRMDFNERWNWFQGRWQRWNWLKLKDDNGTLKPTSLSRWFAAQSQSHRRGREGSLHHKTLSPSLALYCHFNHERSQHSTLQWHHMIWAKVEPLSTLGASRSRARPSKSSSMLRFLKRKVAHNGSNIRIISYLS